MLIESRCLARGRGSRSVPGVIVAALSVGALVSLSARLPDGRQEKPASAITRHSSGSFRFVDGGTNNPITVWFCRTPTITPDTRVVFVMHGSESQTARQACDIATPYVPTHNAIVLAPQFAEEYYPGGDAGSMAQGKTRLARGLRFFAAALDEATTLGTQLHWRLRIAAGENHSAVPMVRAALEELDKQQ